MWSLKVIDQCRFLNLTKVILGYIVNVRPDWANQTVTKKGGGARAVR